MKIVTIGETEYKLLDPDEVDCEHEFLIHDRYDDVVVNPNGEFVEGYGYARVVVHMKVGEFKRCVKCGFVLDGEI